MADTEAEYLQRLSPEERAAYERMMYSGRSKAAQQPTVTAPVPTTQPALEQTSQPVDKPQVDMARIKRNIGRMIDQNAPENEIDAYVSSEGVTGDQLRAHKNEPQQLSWSDVPGQALQNAPASAVRTATAMAYPFLHPIDTATAIGQIGKGALSKVEGALGVDQDPQAKAESEAHIDAIGQFFKDRYGSADAIKKSLAEDPVGVAADLAAVLSGGGAIVSRAPGAIGRAGEVIAKAGSTIDPLTNVGRAVRGTGNAVSEIVGLQSGVSGQPLRAAFDAGREGGTANTVFRENMNGTAPVTDVLDMAQSAMGQVRKERSDAYNAGMTSVDASMKRIDYRPVAKAIQNAAQNVYMGKFAKSQEAADTIKAITSKFEEFVGLDDSLKNTAKGADVLKQALGEIRQGTKHGTVSRNIANSVYNAVKNEIVKQVPEYAETMRGYSQASDTLDDLSRTFSLGEHVSKDTSVRKLTSAMRNNVNTNYGRREQLMKVLAQHEPDIPYAIAGQSLNALAPRGLARLAAGGAASGMAGMALTSGVNPLALAVLPLSSPRLMGETANALGRGYGAIEDAGNALMIDPALAANLLRGGYITNQVSQPALVGEQDIGADTPEELKRQRR